MGLVVQCSSIGIGLSVDQAPGQFAVSVDPSVAQEGPVRPGFVHLAQVQRSHDNLFSAHARFGQDLASSAGDKTLAPELESVAAGRRFQTDAVADGDVTTVSHRMAALDCFPGAVLVLAVR